MKTCYSSSILEEELKNKVAADWFSAFDCSRILGKVDFCAAVPATDLPLCDAESVLWAEAKRGVDAPLDFALVQLILTLGKERTFDRYLPPKYLAAFNAARIAFIPYSEVVEIFYQNDFNWNVAPSDHETREFGDLYQRVIRILESATLEFDFAKDEVELRRFIRANLHTGGSHTNVAVQITKNNFTHIYQRWREAVMPTILMPDWATAKKNGILDADFFLADIFSSDNAAVTSQLNVLLMNDHYRQARGTDALGFQLFSEISFSDGQKAHRIFWNRYKRPPRKEYWNYIVNRRDLLVPQDVRERKGSFFTPQKWVSLSQDYLAAVLGENWQEDHYVWDCCAGTGNLLVGLTNKYNVWASTLDLADVDAMHQRVSLGANLLDSHIFQFDFLNDPFDKLPQGLSDIINDPEKRKRLVIYINPPYAEHSNRKVIVGTGENRTNVAKESQVYNEFVSLVGTATRELYIQFFLRISKEMGGAVLASFSTMKFVCSQNCAKFRRNWKSDFKTGFICPADTFDNVSGAFPIAFTIWRLGGSDEIQSVNVDVFDKNTHFMGKRKFQVSPVGGMISDWLRRFYDPNSKETLAYMSLPGVSMQQRASLFITSRPTESDVKQHKVARITPVNLIPFVVYLAVRHCMTMTWENNKDEFCRPIENWEEDTGFKADCLVFALFDNIVKSRDGVNHWIPFTEEEVGAKDCFTSHFMSDWLAGRVSARSASAPYQGDLFAETGEAARVPLPRSVASPNQSPIGEATLSLPARAVMDAGRELWRYYHAQTGANPNASYYDIRLHFQGVKRTASGKEQMNPTSSDAKYNELLAALRSAHKALAAQIAPKVYEYGFLKR